MSEYGPPLKGGLGGGVQTKSLDLLKDADRTLGADGGQCRHRPCPPAEMSAQAKQRNMTQEAYLRACSGRNGPDQFADPPPR